MSELGAPALGLAAAGPYLERFAENGHEGIMLEYVVISHSSKNDNRLDNETGTI